MKIQTKSNVLNYILIYKIQSFIEFLVPERRKNQVINNLLLNHTYFAERKIENLKILLIKMHCQLNLLHEKKLETNIAHKHAKKLEYKKQRNNKVSVKASQLRIPLPKAYFYLGECNQTLAIRTYSCLPKGRGKRGFPVRKQSKILLYYY